MKKPMASKLANVADQPRQLLVLLFFCAAFLSSAVFAEKRQLENPQLKIEAKTAQILAEVKAAKTYFDETPDRFYAQVDVLLLPLIDFPSFTRSVMGPFGKRDYYVSLNKVQREQFKADYKRFVEVFKSGLINTYAKGLLAFDGQDIQVLDLNEDDAQLVGKFNQAIAAGESMRSPTVSVQQTIQGAEKTFTITYRMRANKKGLWLVRNVVIGSISVGELYQNQFVAAMKKHGNDFSKVIDNWVAETDTKAIEKDLSATEK